MKAVKTWAAMSLALCLALCMAGCNTVSGAGEDLKAAGGAIKEAAQKTKERITK